MDWLIEQWSAFAAWAASQPVPLQILIGSLVLLAAYLVFALALTRIGVWVRRPILPAPELPGKQRPGPDQGRHPGRQDLPPGQHSRSSA